ncbi:hypothetical protein BC941DRAFT_471873 [Chlamydoabsidia padenii]|nr:hypothetical protein BC941DRAFT_471873 [Chlamydoabsidia padenii]
MYCAIGYHNEIVILNKKRSPSTLINQQILVLGDERAFMECTNRNLKFNHKSLQLCSLPLGQYARKLVFVPDDLAKDIISLLGYTPLVKSLALCYSKVTDKGFMRMVSRCLKLKRCRLIRCGNFTQNGVASLADHCLQLDDLELVLNKQTTSMVLLGLKNCPLERLRFSFLDWSGAYHLTKLFLPAANKLSPLFPMLNDLPITNLDTIADSMPDLQHLDLLGNKGITVPAMERLGKACTKLTWLNTPRIGFFDGTYTFPTARDHTVLEQKELAIIPSLNTAT